MSGLRPNTDIQTNAGFRRYGPNCDNPATSTLVEPTESDHFAPAVRAAARIILRQVPGTGFLDAETSVAAEPSPLRRAPLGERPPPRRRRDLLPEAGLPESLRCTTSRSSATEVVSFPGGGP
jgi:hypothetical protein